MCVLSAITEPGLTQSSGTSDIFRAYRSNQHENSGKSLIICAERTVVMETIITIFVTNYDCQVMTALGPYTPQSALRNPPHLMKMIMMMLASEKLTHDFENKCLRSFYLQNNILFLFFLS